MGPVFFIRKVSIYGNNKSRVQKLKKKREKELPRKKKKGTYKMDQNARFCRDMAGVYLSEQKLARYAQSRAFVFAD